MNGDLEFPAVFFNNTNLSLLCHLLQFLSMGGSRTDREVTDYASRSSKCVRACVRAFVRACVRVCACLGRA